jgi:hypothetical protein
MSIATLLQMFGPQLDIVYPRADQTVESIGYQNIMYWNDTRLIPDSPAMPPQSPAGNESAWQLPIFSPQQSTSPFHDANSLNIYVIGVSVLAAAAVFAIILKSRKKPQII